MDDVVEYNRDRKVSSPRLASHMMVAESLLTAHVDLIARVRDTQRNNRRLLRALPSPPLDLLKLPLIPSPSPSLSPSPPSSPLLALRPKPPPRPDLPPPKRARLARYPNYVPEEETIRNDYSQRYVDSGEWPQNWVVGAELERRFEEYPKQQRLLNLKKESVDTHAAPSCYLPLQQLPSLHPFKFDVILLDPPFSSSFGWVELQEFPIPSLAADPSFVFMWVGSGAGEGLERGREVLAKWGYRRCEDIVWVKTNLHSNRGPGTDPPTTSLLTRTKQHCLMGIKGTVRRSTDNWFVHCNVDTDVIIWEGDPSDPTRKPPETYALIENFCLGTRRLEIFGRARSSLRRGWVSVLAEGEHELVPELARNRAPCIPDGARPWDKDGWEEVTRKLAALGGGKCVVPNTQEIETLRPKSPVRSGPLPGGGGVSGGVGVGVGVSGGVGVALGPPRGGRPNMPPHQAAQNQMHVSPMMGMGMGGMGIGVGMPVDMGGWPGMGMGVNMNLAGMGMGNMNMPMGMMMNGMGNMGMGGMMGGMNGMGMNQWTQPGYDGFQ
ncbi:MT-A70-domain-containing protein [Boletus edulis BED1]|uniref:MT-A70-domain-containing protein n=1 Tax=Boletus edulis BED1 TaxID=1328754 RepID=A0AAD4GDZ8_BOLED|nr:MT-A70-domain-containing protein [Boletus edulis BED1]